MENLKKELTTLVKEYREKIDYLPVDETGSSFKIGDIEIKAPVVTAPLAGISDNTFRIFANAFGSALNFTEMISSYGIHYNNPNTFSLSYITEYERPCGVQLFGSEPEIMAEAATALQDRADFIDINMGCPVPKVLKTKSGGYLLTDEKRIESIISKVVCCIKKPLTVKIRLGWDSNSINADRVSMIVQNSGASAITIHGRTVKQGFKGKADYGIIGKIKKELKIPVIVSGDIDSPARARHVLESTGCDAVMIGRAAKGRPWIFSDILAGFYKAEKNFSGNGCSSGIYEKGFAEPEVSRASIRFKEDFALLYLKFLVEFLGEEKAAKEFRKHFIWIFRGIPKIQSVKKELPNLNDYHSFEKIIRSFS